MLQGRISRLVGIVVGVVLVAGTVYMVKTFKRRNPPPEKPPVVRPVKTLIVGAPVSTSLRKYPGRVRALQQAAIAFEVPGLVTERFVNRGDIVKKGDKIAQLDPRDYENQLAAAEANLNKSQVYLDRVREALSLNAATVQELTDAEADVQIAEAAVEIKKKALDDTIIYASFDGVIANTFVEQYENVDAKQAIVSLQDNTKVLIDASIPEWRFVESRDRDDVEFQFGALFDYLPDMEFPVTVREFTTEADPVTQTYEVTFLMEVPENINILPGMTSTINESTLESSDAGGGFAIPLAAVPVDSFGQYYAWRLDPAEGGRFTIVRVNVDVGEMRDQEVIILKGLERDDRIAAAGVHMLEDGQIVTLWDPKKGVVTK